MKQLLKNLFFPGGNKPRRVLFGNGKGIVLELDPSSNLQRLLGIAEREIAPDFARLAADAATFCDVGASDGWYVMLARKIKPSLNVVAYEPDGQLTRSAYRNMARNAVRTDVHFRWLSERCGSGARDVGLDVVLEGAPEPIFLKVDIEGGELDALTSGNEVLSSKRCSLIVETHRGDLEVDCAKWLEQRGYRVRIVPPAPFRSLVPEFRPLPHNQWLIAESHRSPVAGK